MPKTIRRCEIVSNLKDKDNNSLFDLEKMEQVLVEKQSCLKEYAWIIHNKDTYTAEDEEKNPDHKEGKLKPEHIHLLLRFVQNQPQQIGDVPRWFGLAPNFLEKIKGRWSDAVKYLIHANTPEKFQYSVDEVTANFDVENVIFKDNQDYLDSVINGILDGTIREYNKTLEIDKKVLVQKSRLINEAFKVRSEYLQATKLERNTEVIFITGPAGCGKTTLAKKIATERGLAYFVSSGSNDIMDGYGQQPCLIIDDARPSSMGLSDFLKLLDNNTPSSVKSRYKNKYLNCDLIIITTVLSIDNFYHNVFESENEPINQLKRRCRTLIQMDTENINISLWDSVQMKYVSGIKYVNAITKKYISEPKSRTDVAVEIEKMFPFLLPVWLWKDFMAEYEYQEKCIKKDRESGITPDTTGLQAIEEQARMYGLELAPSDSSSESVSGENDKNNSNLPSETPGLFELMLEQIPSRSHSETVSNDENGSQGNNT